MAHLPHKKQKYSRFACRLTDFYLPKLGILKMFCSMIWGSVFCQKNAHGTTIILKFHHFLANTTRDNVFNRYSRTTLRPALDNSLRRFREGFMAWLEEGDRHYSHKHVHLMFSCWEIKLCIDLLHEDLFLFNYSTQTRQSEYQVND